MVYLSKGVVKRKSTVDHISLIRGNREYLLTGIEADMWLRGRFSFANTECEPEAKAVFQLSQKDLVEIEKESDDLQKYRILTRCVCCSTKRVWKGSARLSDRERQIDTWLRKAGIHLSVAEIVYLIEHQIPTNHKYLRAENRHNLILSIYCQENIQDNLLEQQMEQAKCRDEVVYCIMQLLKKKKIVIL